MPSRSRRDANGTAHRRTNAQVLREEDVCAWCGQWVDKTLPPFDPMAAAVDHIIPVKLGGPKYDRANKQLMHRHCNREKGIGGRRPIPAEKTITSQPW